MIFDNMVINTNLHLLLMVFMISLADCTGPGNMQKEITLEPFAVSYEKIENRAEIANKYKLLIVEPDHYSKPEIDSLNTSTNKLIAYVSLGEVNRNRWYYPLLEKRGFLGVNEQWGSQYLNLADSTTRAILLGKVIPNIMKKGFDGLFLDTVDGVAPYTDRSHLQSCMIDMIAKIHKANPQAFVVQNSGLFMLDKTNQFIDAVLIEDVASSYNFGDQTYGLKLRKKYKDKVESIGRYSSLYDKPILIVDFSDKELLNKKIKNRLDSLSYPYFIGPIQLNNIKETISSIPSH
ncbi:endo alpha-1,4 polygalactosaminidase [Fodinibius sediminis]|uniref:Extracellular protein n=1 Tax=Fodinibius sediminis TaxID=1214077 RepID=A0A521DCV7_9BACT|nr:endo alpha-1,4 polygalactosaminidase [Fodinibius sediminis]SMO69509.1 extracellular protein [Fodinibius sediminis]